MWQCCFHKFCGKGEIGLKLVNQAGLDLRYGVVDTAAAFDQVFIVGFTTGELTESSGILSASFQQDTDHRSETDRQEVPDR